MSRPNLVECTNSPLYGLWGSQPHPKHMFYGPSCVRKHLCSILPSSASRVFIITGRTIARSTPLIQDLQTLLGPYHAGTFAAISQHGPVAEVEQALEMISADDTIDTILSVGGGSPIDSAKTISYRINERKGRFLTHITIPTTLSAAECTAGGGYTGPDGVKLGFMAAGMGVTSILYDPEFARYTPPRLFLATGIRAVDHAVETIYHPNSSEMPWKALACWALGVLFECLPKIATLQHSRDTASVPAPADASHDDTITRLLLAAFASSGLRGTNFAGGMGLSHSLGHALGSPYGIPHGETSCMTLPRVVRLKAQRSLSAAQELSRLLLPAIGEKPTSDPVQDAMRLATRIEELVDTIGLRPKSLTELGVGLDQIPLIVQRSVGSSGDAGLRTAVAGLVESLF